MLYIRSAYDSEQCINEIYDEVANKYVSVETINTTLPPDFQIPAVWKHNIGRVPIKLIQNKPYPSPYYTLGNLIECSDTHGCEKLKHHINTTHREYLKYIIVAKPRVALGGMTAYETTKKFNDDDESFG
jgi:hypothetical protein